MSKTKFNGFLFVGGICCTNALLWLFRNPILWWPIAICSIVGILLTAVGVYRRRKELRKIEQEKSLSSKSVFYHFTKGVEYYSGNWIAICLNGPCNFASRMPASGMAEAKKIALERHNTKSNPNNFQHSGYCSAPKIIVGYVPDE